MTAPRFARRDMLRALSLGPFAAARAQPPRDRFGGWPGVRFPPSGFFRLEKADRWWLVTPDGNAFLSFGLNHVEFPGLLTQRENIEHWKRRFGAADARDPRFLAGFRNKVRHDLDAFGFNTLGCHSPMRHEWFPESFVPYVHTFRTADICHYMTPVEADFHDVFSDAYVERCDALARIHVAPRKHDPFLLGYFLIDCPIFTELDAAPRANNVYGAERAGLPTWPRVLRNLGPRSPGKQAYVDSVRALYSGNIRAFNKTYDSSFGSFDALLDAGNWRAAADPGNALETRDNLEFLKAVVDRHYAVVVAALRRHDPNHLIFGDKLNGNTDTPDFIVELAARRMDLIFYQMYGAYAEHKPRLDRWSRLGAKALFCGDASFAAPNPPMMPDPYGPHCRSQEERAALSREFARRSFARPDFVGWSVCGWLDSWKNMPRREKKQHGGLQDPFGRYYDPLLRALSTFSKEMYDVARDKAPA